jgi:hypothetical protein
LNTIVIKEVGQNGALQENQHFYVVSKLEKKSKFTHRQKEASKFAIFVYKRVGPIKKIMNMSGIEWYRLNGTETIGHFLLDFLVIHKVKWIKRVLI